MIFKSVPGRVVQKRIRKQGKWKIVVWFKFDEEGLAEIDETKISVADLVKLKTKFEVVDNMSTHKVDDKVNLEELKYKELQEIAKERGINAFGVKKDALIKLLEVE